MENVCYTFAMKKITIITVGTPQLSFTKDGIAEYMKRIGRFAQVDLIHVKENKNTSGKILKLCDKKFCILLDEKGKQYSSTELADFLESKHSQSIDLVFVIGGPDGHEPEIRNIADDIWSLSRLTFPHDMAVLILIETLYRSLSINQGHPYHRV